MPLTILIAAFAGLASMGGAPRASIRMGQKKEKEAEKILGNCTSMLVIISVILTAVFFIFGRKLLLLFGASKNTIEYADAYMKIYACGTIFVQLSIGLNAFITAQGLAAMGMLTVVLGAVFNIILDPIFIFDMGVQGAALATVISQAASAVWVVLFLPDARRF